MATRAEHAEHRPHAAARAARRLGAGPSYRRRDQTPGALCDIISLVAQSGWKGELVVIEERKVRSLYFDAGNVIGAHTNVPEERLGETLFRFGVVTREQLDKAVAASSGTGKRFGEAAIDLDFVSPEELYPMMARQVEEVFYAALHVADGMFYFFDRYDEAAIGRRHALNAGMLLMKALVAWTR